MDKIRDSAQRTLARDLGGRVGSDAYLAGFIRNVREFKGFRFVFLRDRSGTSQIVVPNEVCSGKIGYEDIVGVNGTVVGQPKSKYGGVEVLAKGIEFLARGRDGACFNQKDEANLNMDTALDRRAASLRLEENRAVFAGQSRIIEGFTAHLRENDFVQVNTPKIIVSALEGGSDLFRIDYFKNAAYLSQSPQLYHQILMSSFERVFEIGPCFRAEDYATSRHINEFTSLDVHMAFINDHVELMNLLEAAMNKIKLPELVMVDKIPRINYGEAISATGNREVGRKLSGEDKREIGANAKEKYASDFVFVDDFPAKASAFYVLPSSEHGTKSFKLLYKGQEICSGGMRINDYDQLTGSMLQKGLDPEQFKDYLEAFKCGMPPHGGFCVGINRLTALAFDLDNVKRAVLFPRDPRRLTP